MFSRIEVSPEVIRLTQQRANRLNFPYRKQVARYVAELAVLELDPEANFLVDNESSLAEVDVLVRALKVNDIVVNGRHIDVSLLEDGEVLMANALVDTPYLECGSLVVHLDGANTGSVVGYIESTAWSAISRIAGGADLITLSFSPVATFDLASCLEKIEKTMGLNVNKPVDRVAQAEDYLQFSRDRRNMSLEKQRLVVTSAVSSADVRKNIGHLSSGGQDVTGRVLRDSAVWEVRAVDILEKIQTKFPEIPARKIEESIRSVGAKYGGQPQAPAFKKSLLKLIARQHLEAKFSRENFSPEARALMESFIDKVAAGKGKVEAIREYVKNQAAVDVARVISEKRDALQRFATASADEIGLAYQQLSLQPAYATHSASDSTGLQAINEALNLFEAGRIVEEFMEIDI